MSSEFLKFAAALFAILNPLGNIAIFPSVTAERTSAERQKIAVMTTAAVLVTLLVLTRLMGVLLAAIAVEMIAGGLTELFPQLRPAGG
jgi:multiple antibiotic resistance protein